MIQRKCGTCRYFEEGGIAASGWCRHPERQDLQHMVLVRKTELACRDGWDHDLWEPRDDSAASMRRDSGNQGTASTEFSEMATAGVGSGVASEHFRGSGVEDREYVPERSPFQSTQTAEYPVKSRDAFPSPQSRDPRSTVDPWSATRGAGGAAQRHAEPESDEVRNETFSTRTVDAGADWRSQLNQLRRSGSVQQPEPPTSPSRDETQENVEADQRTAVSGQMNARPVVERQTPEPAAPERLNDRPPSNQAYEPEPVQQSGRTEPFVFPEDRQESEGETALPNGTHQSGNISETIDLDAITANDDTDDGGPGASRLPPEVQALKCCRTCRDFLPEEGGQRGWCSNPFAFSQRQRVEGDDLACEGTFGSWWSPADDWWIERADISHHSTPTPLVEELIRDIRNRKSNQQGSTGGNERS